MCVNNLPNVVTRKWNGRESKSQPFESQVQRPNHYTTGPQVLWLQHIRAIHCYIGLGYGAAPSASTLCPKTSAFYFLQNNCQKLTVFNNFWYLNPETISQENLTALSTSPVGWYWTVIQKIKRWTFWGHSVLTSALGIRDDWGWILRSNSLPVPRSQFPFLPIPISKLKFILIPMGFPLGYSHFHPIPKHAQHRNKV